MISQQHHTMLPSTSHDEAALQNFVMDYKRFLKSDVLPGRKPVYKARVEPGFRKKNGRSPENEREIWPLMQEEPYWQMWSALQVTAQEMEWDVVGERIERELPELIERAKAFGTSPTRKGSLKLDPALVPPRYAAAIDIHRMPGNYHIELAEEDVFAGVLYDAGLFVHFHGGYGPLNDETGRVTIHYLQTNHPEFKPRRILDLGAAIGNSTLPFVDAYPGAEVHAIDVAAPVLRYGHARAEALGKTVHFSQQNAEHTNFPDGHFDLIVSHIMLHETSSKALPVIFKECHRLLAPGGLMLHTEPPFFHKHNPDPFDRFTNDWNTYYLNEPFWGPLQKHDLPEIAVAAGFGRDKAFDTLTPSPSPVGFAHVGHRSQWYVCGAWR
ncbi:MAG: class I SAM-dependent methyltransferase [Betaproteobacteria bacterium]|nr:class I SAM-dependent methyltransferase [Betaproteobacteria bacterium]